MRVFTFAAIAGVSLLTGFVGTPALGQQTPSSPLWSPAKAAAYLGRAVDVVDFLAEGRI